MTPSSLITTTEAAQILEITAHSVYKTLRGYQVKPAVKKGKLLFWNLSDIFSVRATRAIGRAA